MNEQPKLSKITKRNGLAGQVSYSVAVTYPGEPASTLEFIGSVYGGPVVMVTPAGQTFVTDPNRFGKFGPEWVRSFLQLLPHAGSGMVTVSAQDDC